MTEKADLPDEMIPLLHDDQVEAILTGEANGSVPAEYMRVAELVRAAHEFPADVVQSEQMIQADLVAAIAAAVQAPSPLIRRHGRRTRAAAVAAFAAVTLSATAAAAATDNLPGSVQKALANAVSHVGVHLPTGDAGSDQPASPPPATEEAPQQSDASASSASAGASDNAPPAITPASGNDDGTPGNSAHDEAPGDVASEAHADNPSSEDNVHASSGEDNSQNSDGRSNSGGQSSVHSNSIKSVHAKP